MANGTVGQMGVVDKLVRERRAALVLILGRLPGRIEYIGSNAQIRRWVAVAVETPRHCQRRRLSQQRHGGDVAVAGATADAFGDVDRVIEINIIG
jgi:hypothetical protein